jgi:hypothetical protein
MFRFACLTSIVVLFSCATVAPQEQLTPYPREKGKPVSIPVLGTNYTFPANFDLIHYVDKPSIFGVSVVDRITACDAVMNFETTSDQPLVAKFTNEKIEELRNRMTQAGFKVEVKTEDFKALGQTGRLVVVTVINPRDPSDTFYHSRYELFVPDEATAYHGYVECPQNPLRQKTLDVMRTVIASKGGEQAQQQPVAGRK